MVEIWNDSDHGTSDENQAHEISNFALMALGGEMFNKLNDVNK